MIDAPCIVCGHSAPSQTCHYPRTRRFGDAVVPMCFKCHTAQHSGNQAVLAILECKAPEYWKREGLWHLYADEYEWWMSRKKYREAVSE